MELNVKKLTKIYNGRTVLSDVSFILKGKRFLSIVGYSGSGKSTLLRLIAGLEKPDTGKIEFNGEPVDFPTKDIGLLFQDYSLFPWLTVKQNILFGINGTISKKGTAQETNSLIDKAYTLMEFLGLSIYENYYPYQLSGGLQQRVALARTMAVYPRLVLLDEPFSALDPLTRISAYELVKKFYLLKDISFILVTHDIEEALMLGDQLMVFNSNPGRIKAVFDVPFDANSRGYELFFEQEFVRLRKNVLDVLFEGNQIREYSENERNLVGAGSRSR